MCTSWTELPSRYNIHSLKEKQDPKVWRILERYSPVRSTPIKAQSKLQHLIDFRCQWPNLRNHRSVLVEEEERTEWVMETLLNWRRVANTLNPLLVHNLNSRRVFERDTINLHSSVLKDQHQLEMQLLSTDRRQTKAPTHGKLKKTRRMQELLS